MQSRFGRPPKALQRPKSLGPPIEKCRKIFGAMAASQGLSVDRAHCGVYAAADVEAMFTGFVWGLRYAAAWTRVEVP